MVKVTIKSVTKTIRADLFLMLDTETMGGFGSPLCYDVGMAVIDRKGHVYAKYSFVVSDTFYNMPELTKTAYYADKFPRYHEEIARGDRTVATFALVQMVANALIEKWQIRGVVAHNAAFDYKALNNTAKTLNCGNYFFNSPVEWWDTLSMVNDTICKQKTYKKWCEENGYLTKTGRVRMTAEIIYRYISCDNAFEEKHTGIEDVMIEKEIFAHCCRQHKKMNHGFHKWTP